MATNGYRIALDQAINEIADINAQLEMLSRRKEQLDKLLEVLRPLTLEFPSEAAPIDSADAGQVPDAGQVSEVVELAAPVQEAAARESATEGDSKIHEVHQYAEPETASAMEEHAVSSNGKVYSIGYEQVAQLAHQFWTERGHAHGLHEQDWYSAEQELRGMAS